MAPGTKRGRRDPHAAGLAALVIDGACLGDPAEAGDWMARRALDLGDPGPDDVFGTGAIQAGAAPRPCGCTTTANGAPPRSWLVLVLAALSRRKAGNHRSACRVTHEGAQRSLPPGA